MSLHQDGTKPRVVLADDHTDLFAGLRRLLEPHFEIVGTAEDGRSLLRVARAVKPDVFVVDITMPELSGIEAARQLREENPHAKIVFLTMHQEPALLQEALSTGAFGYVLKLYARNELVVALREALQGRRFISSTLRKREPDL